MKRRRGSGICEECGAPVDRHGSRYALTCAGPCRTAMMSRVRLKPPPSCLNCGAAPAKRRNDRGFYRTCSDECARQLKGGKRGDARTTWKGGATIGQLRWRRRLRYKVLSAYSGGSLSCACCGVDRPEFLTIDHVNGGGVAHRKKLGNGNLATGGSKLYKWLIDHRYPPGFRVLCQNCNFARGVWGYCPHQHPEEDVFKVIRDEIRASGEGLREQPSENEAES
jgi:hypothetical protein